MFLQSFYLRLPLEYFFTKSSEVYFTILLQSKNADGKPQKTSCLPKLPQSAAL